MQQLTTAVRSGSEEVVAGIDPSRYSFQLALRSRSQEYFNNKFEIFPQRIRELIGELKAYGLKRIVIEGAHLLGYTTLWEFRKAGFELFELPPYRAHKLNHLLCESHNDVDDAEAAATAGLHFERSVVPLFLDKKKQILYTLCRFRHQLVKEKTRHINRLHKLLSESYGWVYKKLKRSYPLESKYGRKFFQKYPSLNTAIEKKVELKEELGEEIYRLVVKSGKWQAGIYMQELEYLIKQEIEMITDGEKRVRQIEQKMKKAAESVEEANMLMKIPGVGVISASILLTSVKDIKKFEKESCFAGYCGVGPKMWQSGEAKAKSVKRRSYNRKLRAVFYNIAFSAMRVNSKARAYYKRKRKEGKTHRQALAHLARHYARIIYKVWKRGEYHELQ